MKTVEKIGAALAFFIGMMSVFAGSKVLLGVEVKDYNVVIALVAYNVLLGLLSMGTAYFLWKERTIGKWMMWTVFFAHFLVFLYLEFSKNTVANESKMAMLFRLAVWAVIILVSLIIPKINTKK